MSRSRTGRKRINPPSGLRRTIIVESRETCAYCGSLATTVDHVVPLSKGGSNHPTNLVASCSRCNQRAGSRLFASFQDKRDYLLEKIIDFVP